MALYKPSNFYPNMDEVDLEKEEGQEFECKINANGSEVNAYKIEILSEDGVQLYEAYQNLDTPLKNDDFLTVKVKPFILKNNITEVKMDWQLSNWLGEDYWLESQYIKIDKPFIKIVGNFDITENVYPDDLYYAITNNDSYDGTTIEECSIQEQINEGKIDFTIDVSKHLGKYFSLVWLVYVKDGMGISFNNITDDELNSIKNNLSNFYIYQTDNGLSNIQFQSIEQQPYDFLSTYCPYNLWKINIDNLYNFKAKLYKEGQELLKTNIKRFNYDNENKTYDIVFTDNVEEEYDEIKIYLSNNFNYKWNIRLYEQKLDQINQTELKNNTFVTEGYLVGSTGGVCLTEPFYKNNKLLSMTDSGEDYNYLQFEFSENNSDFFKEEISQGLTVKGYVQNIDSLLDSFVNYSIVSVNRSSFDNVNYCFQYYDYGNLKENDIFFSYADKGKDISNNVYNWLYLLAFEPTTNSNLYKCMKSDINNNLPPNNEENSENFEIVENLFVNAELIDANFTSSSAAIAPVVNNGQVENNNFTGYNFYFGGFTGDWVDMNAVFKVPLYDSQNKSFGNSFDITIPMIAYVTKTDSTSQITTDNSKCIVKLYDNIGNIKECQFDFCGYWDRNNFTLSSVLYNAPPMFNCNISIPDNFNKNFTMMELTILMQNVYYNSNFKHHEQAWSISCPGIYLYVNGNLNKNLLLEENVINFSNLLTVDIDNNENGIYLDCKILTKNNDIISIYFENKMNKIQYFDYNSRTLCLSNSQLLNTLEQCFKENPELEILISYELKFYQRLKVYDFKYFLYDKQYFSMFVFDDEMKYMPYYNSICYYINYNNLYNTTTICVPNYTEVNIDRYIRFPSIDNLELSSVSNVQSSDLQYNGKLCLHKIIGLDPYSNEIRFENELERELEWYDTYEIWEKVVNSSDLKNAYYTRLTYPLQIDNYWEHSFNTKIINNNVNNLFIQPNINMKSDKFYMPQLIFNNQVYNIKYDYNNVVGLLFEDNSLFNIENSQYRLTPVEMVNDVLNLEWYKVNSGFVDSTPENYFYAKDRVELNVTAIALFDNIETLKTVPLVYGQTNEISGLDFKFIGSINNSTIKRYRYQMFESNTGIMVYDSNYLYDDKLEMYIQGLIPDCGYVLVLEVETDFGLIYKQDYDLINKIEYVNIIEEGGINRNWCTSKNTTGCLMYTNGLALPMENTINEDIVYNNLMIYKYDNIAPKWDYVATIDNTDTQVIMDYNIRNDNTYQYIVVGFDGSYQNGTNQYTINLYKFYKFNPAKTCFNAYTISDIYKIKDGFYEVGESWNLKYNLENGDVTSNFGSTRHDTMGRYGMVTYDKKNYDSGQITCLLGDIVENKYTETENNNNMRKLLRWKDFITNGNLKLLKDIKGNKWIVSAVDNPNAKYNNNSNNVVMTTISFQWVEVMSSENIVITNTCSLEEFANIEQTSALISASTSSFGNSSGNIVVAQNTLNNGDIVIGAGENRIKTLDGIIFDGGSGE